MAKGDRYRIIIDCASLVNRDKIIFNTGDLVYQINEVDLEGHLFVSMSKNGQPKKISKANIFLIQKADSKKIPIEQQPLFYVIYEDIPERLTLKEEEIMKEAIRYFQPD